MILVDFDESYQNILKSSHIARKKVPLFKNRVFFTSTPSLKQDVEVIDLVLTSALAS